MKLPRSFIKAERLRRILRYELSLDRPDLAEFLRLDDDQDYKLGWQTPV